MKILIRFCFRNKLFFRNTFLIHRLDKRWPTFLLLWDGSRPILKLFGNNFVLPFDMIIAAETKQNLSQNRFPRLNTNIVIMDKLLVTINELPKVLQNEVWEYVRGDRAYWKRNFKQCIDGLSWMVQFRLEYICTWVGKRRYKRIPLEMLEKFEPWYKMMWLHPVKPNPITDKQRLVNAIKQLPAVLQNEIWEYVCGDRACWKQQFHFCLDQLTERFRPRYKFKQPSLTHRHRCVRHDTLNDELETLIFQQTVTIQPHDRKSVKART